MPIKKENFNMLFAIGRSRFGAALAPLLKVKYTEHYVPDEIEKELDLFGEAMLYAGYKQAMDEMQDLIMKSNSETPGFPHFEEET